MRLPFRRKDKDKDKKHDASFVPAEFRPPGAAQPPLFPPTYRSAQLLAHLPPGVLERIFAFVCPHAQDESYETCEGSANDSGCMLCDQRDLSHCAKVDRRWRISAVKVLYHSVRIDPVHYCRLEAWLAEKRKKTSRFDKNGVPEDTAQARLRLFRRTVRDDPTRLGRLVEFLKVPYMLRESSHVELAQTIAVLPSLQYVDLPEGMFADEPSYATLRLEVQARCPNIRKMTYVQGSERSFADLASGRVWPRLEVLELNGLQLDAMTMRSVLASLANLRALKVTETHSFSDEVLTSGDGLSELPPLEELVLKDTPRVTKAGLVEYLAWHETQQALKVLTLKDTGVHPASLQEVLTMASSLTTLALQAKISEPFPHAAGLRPLASRSLETLRYELSGTSSLGAYANLASGYYTYLASSILSDSLPNLRRLYVHDDSFPEQLQGLPPPNAAFAGRGHVRNSSAASNKSSNLSPMRNSPASPGFSPGLSPGLLAPLPPPTIRRPVSNVPPTNRFSSNNPFASRAPASPPAPHMLEIFTKSDEFDKWNFTRVNHRAATALAAPPTVGESRRPVSSYGLAADVAGQGWDGGEARRSVMIGSGTGGFLAVSKPEDRDEGGGGSWLSDSWRPSSSSGAERDLWR